MDLTKAKAELAQRKLESEESEKRVEVIVKSATKSNQIIDRDIQDLKENMNKISEQNDEGLGLLTN